MKTSLIPNLKTADVARLMPLQEEVPAVFKGVPTMQRETRVLLHLMLLVLTQQEQDKAILFVEDVLTKGHLEDYGDFHNMVSLIPHLKGAALMTNNGFMNLDEELENWLDYYQHLKYKL